MIDPTLVPLPTTDDARLVHPPSIAKAVSGAAAHKVAGSQRQPRKRKDRVHVISDDDSEADLLLPQRKKGQPSGSGNYADGDVKALLSFVDAELPLGQRGWRAVHARYTKWARLHKRPERAPNSLETKYKQLVRITKPTGSGEIRENVFLAQEIEKRINERAGTRALSDSEFEDQGNVAEGANKQVTIEISSDEDVKPVSSKVQARIGHASEVSSVPVRNARTSRGQELMEKLNKAFDPSVQRARDTSRAMHALDHAHYVGMSQQLRDSQATIETLRGDMMKLQSSYHSAEMVQERAEMRMEMMQLTMRFPGNASTLVTPKYPRKQMMPAIKRKPHNQRKSLQEEVYADGGGCIRWLTDTEPNSASEKENQHRMPLEDTISTLPSPLAAFSKHPKQAQLISQDANKVKPKEPLTADAEKE